MLRLSFRCSSPLWGSQSWLQPAFQPASWWGGPPGPRPTPSSASPKRVPIMIEKVRPHITQNESLLFELSSPGKRGYQLPALDVPPVDPASTLGASNVRKG